MVEKIKQALERAYQERMGAGELGSLDTVDTTLKGDDQNPAPLSPDAMNAKGQRPVAEILGNARPHSVDSKLMLHNRVITLDNSDPEVESYRLLRTQLVRMVKAGNLKTLGITSSSADEGKTLTSVNLAISLANTADTNVVLVDGDISNPSVHGLLGLHNETGLLDYLKGDAELSEILWKLDVPNLWLVAGRSERISLLDQALSGRVESMLEAISTSVNTLILVDLPPVLAKDDTLALASHLDGVLLVVAEGSTKEADLSRSVELLKQSNVIGSVLNKFSRKQASYY